MPVSFIARFVFTSWTSSSSYDSHLVARVARHWGTAASAVKSTHDIFISATFKPALTVIESEDEDIQAHVVETVEVTGSQETGINILDWKYQMAVQEVTKRCKELIGCDEVHVVYFGGDTQVL